MKTKLPSWIKPGARYFQAFGRCSETGARIPVSPECQTEAEAKRFAGKRKHTIRIGVWTPSDVEEMRELAASC